MSRGRCKIDGCTNLVAGKGNGRYRSVCGTHHRGKRSIIDTDRCAICGWDKARCDKHRIVWGCNGGKYTKGNVVSLCPNCHRLIHLRLINIS